MPSLRLISNSSETTSFNLQETAVELAPRQTIVGAMVSVNLEVGISHSVGCVDRKATRDRGGLGEA